MDGYGGKIYILLPFKRKEKKNHHFLVFQLLWYLQHLRERHLCQSLSESDLNRKFKECGKKNI